MTTDQGVVEKQINHSDSLKLSLLYNKTIIIDSLDDSLCKRVVLPYPFIDAFKTSYDFVLIPSTGTFLENFNNKTGLHIAIVSEVGEIIEFDRRGIRRGSGNEARWTQCLDLKFLNRLLCDRDKESKSFIESSWNTALSNMDLINNIRWTKQSYDRDENNCFDFVLVFLQEFLNLMSAKRINKFNIPLDQLEDKTKFCEQLVVPETRQVAKYLSLYRKINTIHD